VQTPLPQSGSPSHLILIKQRFRYRIDCRCSLLAARQSRTSNTTGSGLDGLARPLSGLPEKHVHCPAERDAATGGPRWQPAG
jgi:hypothetical protein